MPHFSTSNFVAERHEYMETWGEYKKTSCPELPTRCMSVLFMAQLHLLYTWGQVSSSATLVNIIYLYNIHVLQILWVETTWQRKLQPNMHPVESWGCLVLNESCNRLEYIHVYTSSALTKEFNPPPLYPPGSASAVLCLLHATWVPAWQTPSKEEKLRKSCEVGSVNVVSMAICFKPGSLFICVHHHAWCNSAITM